jgi:hypothetical protein
VLRGGTDGWHRQGLALEQEATERALPP